MPRARSLSLCLTLLFRGTGAAKATSLLPVLPGWCTRVMVLFFYSILPLSSESHRAAARCHWNARAQLGIPFSECRRVARSGGLGVACVRGLGRCMMVVVNSARLEWTQVRKTVSHEDKQTNRQQ